MTLRPPQGVEIGLFGKIPSRGDFVRSGLPGHFIVPWDTWLQEVIAASRTSMGADWLPAYLESPVWRFALPAGMCGPGSVIGVMMPSVDRVGRYFPLTLAAAIAPGGYAPPDNPSAWLDACEVAGRAALEADLTPEQVLQRLPAFDGSGATTAAVATWWTEGGPRVPPTRLSLAALPDALQFAAMLDESAVARKDA